MKITDAELHQFFKNTCHARQVSFAEFKRSFHKSSAASFGRLGGLKSRNQKQAAKASHSRAAEAKRRATRAAKNGVGSTTDGEKS